MTRNQWRLQQALKQRQPERDINLSWLPTLVAFLLLACVVSLALTWGEEPADVVSAKMVAERDAQIRGKK